MEKKKVFGLLEKIKFDYLKHDSIKEAIKEVLDSDIYSPIMKGIVTDEKLLSEVRDIINAYNELKEIDSSLIEEIINELKNNSSKVDIDINNIDFNENIDTNIKQIIIDDTDSKEVVLKVKNEDGSFLETARFSKDEFKFNYYTYSISGVGTFNLLGKKISDIDNCISITPNIYELADKNKTIYIHLDGRKIEIDENNKKLETLFDSFLISGNDKKEMIFNNYLDNRLEYLSYEIKNITRDYIYCSNENEFAWFTLEGEKIISTEDDFPFIYNLDDKEVEDGKNIVIVGDYNSKFEQVYGYYDLDKRKLIQEPIFKKAFPWASYVTSAIDQDGNAHMYKIVDDKLEKISGCFHIKEIFDILYIPSLVIKLSEELYIVNICVIDGISHDKYLVVKNLLTKPEVVLTEGVEYDNTNFRKFIKIDYLNGIYGSSDDNILKTISLENGEVNVSNVTPEFIKNNYKYNKEEKIGIESKNNNLGILENSSFLLPMIKNNQLMVINKNELIEKVSGYSLSKIYKKKETLCPDNNENYEIKYMRLFENKIFFEKAKQNSEYQNILDPKSGKVLSENKDIKILSTIDANGYIIVQAVYGNGFKKYILDNDYNIVLGPVDNIFVTGYKDVLIITNKKKQQLYQNYLPISYQADKIDVLTKYYVNDYGMVIDTECIFKIQNNNSKFIVDEDGDNVLEQSEQTKDIIDMLENIDNDLLETKVKQKKINGGF